MLSLTCLGKCSCCSSAQAGLLTGRPLLRQYQYHRVYTDSKLKQPNCVQHKVAEQRIKLQKECRAARTSKRTIEGAIEGEPPTQRARSLASSTSLTAETTPFGGAGAPFNVAGDAAPAGRRGSVAGDRTPRAAGTQHINAAALPVFHPPKMEKPSSEWYSHSIGQDVLNQLPEGDAFRNMIVNFHQGRGNSRFKVPNFGGVEVDLSVLFNEILVRGGVYTIAENRLWKEVVRYSPSIDSQEKPSPLSHMLPSFKALLVVWSRRTFNLAVLYVFLVQVCTSNWLQDVRV